MCGAGSRLGDEKWCVSVLRQAQNPFLCQLPPQASQVEALAPDHSSSRARLKLEPLLVALANGTSNDQL